MPATDLSGQINSADEATWKRLSAALGVADRQAAIELCATNPGAATKAREILGATAEPAESLLTASPDESLLTRKSKGRSKRPDLAGLMYSGSSGAKW